MKNLFTLILTVCACAAGAQIYTVETVPNSRLENGSRVSDPAHLLKLETVSELDTLLVSLEHATTAQVAVVMLPSIGEEDPVDFSQKLFSAWKIGQKENDNGLLVVFIADKHVIRFHTGFGLEGILTDLRCKEIEEMFMVPLFREGKIDDGMIRGLQQVNALLLNPDNAAEINADGGFDSNGFFYLFVMIFSGVLFFIAFIFEVINDKFSRKPDVEPGLRMNWQFWLVIYLVMPAVLIVFAFVTEMPVIQFFVIAALIIFFYFGEKMVRTMRQASAMDVPSAWYMYGKEVKYWKVASFIFPLPALIGFYTFRKERDTLRNGKRSCRQCGNAMARETEKTEDQFLKAGQILEEKLKVTDYDVWRCGKCQSLEVIPFPEYGNRAMYSICPSCHFTTLQNIRSRTLRPATYDAEGSGERDYRCANCKFTKTEKYVIARLTPPSSSSSDSDSSSSSSGSSGGSDWGGGSSGGGGASSTW